MYTYLTGSTATQIETGLVRHAVVMVNTNLTGTLAIIDGTSGNTANVATITNPTAGCRFDYYNLASGFRIKCNTTCDVTAQTDNLLVS